MSGFTNLRFDDFKREDNTNMLTTNIVNDDGKVITPNKEHTWMAKVVNMKNNKFAGNYAVTISGDDISVSSKGMEKLLSGRYGLELWEEFGNNKTIYPSAGFIEFNIHRNGDDALEPDDKSIDITDVIEELHQAGLNVVIDKVNMLEPTAAPSVSSEIRDGKNQLTFNIPKGEQGPVGAPGNDGHTPIKGIDYWTASDQQSIEDQINKIKDDAFAKAKAVGEALVTKPDNYDLPILYLYGAGIEGMQSKKDTLSEGLSFSFPRFNVSGTLTGIKVQGASSAGLAKKNYTLHLDRKIELIPGYGKQKKYVIKADMTDFSHVRNVGCAKLWGEVRKTRIKADDAIKVNDTDYLVDNAGNHITGESDPQLSIGGNYGAVDGFPIAVYINDKYWGLYTFNVPKDDWMAKMPKKQGCAIVSTVWASFNESTRLDGKDMDIEFCGTEDSDWVFRSINNLIDGVKASYTSKDDFEKVVLPLLDIDSAIDYYVYSVAIGNVDGVVRNFNLQTWDGKKWYFAAYDLDMVFGRTPDLLDYLSPEYNGSSIRHGGITFENLSGGNRIFHQLWKFYKADIIARYKELVQSVLSASNVSTFLTNYAKSMPIALKIQEDKLWPQTPLTDTNNLEQIRWWYMLHINFLNNLVANA